MTNSPDSPSPIPYRVWQALEKPGATTTGSTMDQRDEDPIERLTRLDIVVCYAPRMQHDLIWLPEDGLVVLNAEASRRRLGLAVADLLWEIGAQTAPRGRLG